MAKLRVINRSKTGHPLSEDGYVNLVTALQDDTNFFNFVSNPSVTMLKTFIKDEGSSNTSKVHLVQAEAKLDGDDYKIIDEESEIDDQKCELVVKKDKYYVPSNAEKSKFTISLPPFKKKNAGSLPSNLSYLETYIQQIIKLHLTKVTINGKDYYQDDKSATDKDKAYKFMFGAMLLTRCR